MKKELRYEHVRIWSFGVALDFCVNKKNGLIYMAKFNYRLESLDIHQLLFCRALLYSKETCFTDEVGKKITKNIMLKNIEHYKIFWGVDLEGEILPDRFQLVRKVLYELKKLF